MIIIINNRWVHGDLIVFMGEVLLSFLQAYGVYVCVFDFKKKTRKQDC